MVSQKHCSEQKMALEEKIEDGALEMLLYTYLHMLARLGDWISGFIGSSPV